MREPELDEESELDGPDTDSRPQEDMGTAVLSSLPLTVPIAFDLPDGSGQRKSRDFTSRLPSMSE